MSDDYVRWSDNSKNICKPQNVENTIALSSKDCVNCRF